MIREADLASYLPIFMQKYKEPVATLEAENPEFDIAWNEVNKILYNHFISTADEHGIAQFEKILGILPSEEDDIESRRVRVQTKWVNKLPYTIRILTEKIKILSAGADFVIETDLRQGYWIIIHTMLELIGQVKELEHIIDRVIPCNMVATSVNHIHVRADGEVYAGASMTYTDIIEIKN